MSGSVWGDVCRSARAKAAQSSGPRVINRAYCYAPNVSKPISMFTSFLDPDPAAIEYRCYGLGGPSENRAK